MSLQKSKMRTPHSRLILVVVICSCLTMVPAGYQLTVLNNPQSLLERFVNDSFHYEHGRYLHSGAMSILWSSIVASLAVGALIGCFLVVPFVRYFGRKHALLVANCVLLLVGSALSGIAIPTRCFECLLVGRLLLGAYSGCGMCILAVFINECSPPEFRGTLSCFIHIFVALGGAIGAFLGIDAVLGNGPGLASLLCLPIMLGLSQFLVLPLVKETPKFLHDTVPFSERAIESARYYYGPGVNPRLVLYRFDEAEAESPPQLSFLESINQPAYRKLMFLSALVNFGQIFTGLMALVSYSTVILRQLGVPQYYSQYVTAFGALLAVVFAIPALYMVERAGRRPLLISTFGALSVIIAGLMICGILVENSVDNQGPIIVFIILALLFLMVYNLGPGPLPFFLPGELAPDTCKSSYLALGTAVNWLSTVVSTLVFFPLNEAIGSASFIMFLVPTTVCTAVFYYNMPETRSLAPDRSNLNESEFIATSTDTDFDNLSNSSSGRNQNLYGTFGNRDSEHVVY